MDITEKFQSPSEIGSDEGDNASYRGITILDSLSSSLNEAEQRVQALEPLLPNTDSEMEHTGSVIVTVKSEASLSLTPSMVIPMNLRSPTPSSSSWPHHRGTTNGIASQQRRNCPDYASGNDAPYQAEKNQSRFVILLVVIVSLFVGFSVGFFAGKEVSNTRHDKIVSQYLNQFNEIIAQKDDQIKEIALQRENRALYWEIVRAGTIAIASSVAQVVAGPLTDYFIAEVDTK